MRPSPFVLLVLAACGGEKAQPSPSAGASDDLARFRLAEEPADPLGVAEARDVAAGEEVAVVGRVGSIVSGYAAFQLVDEVLDYCGSGADPLDACPTPWDYCCVPSTEKAGHTLTVELRDAGGRPVATQRIEGMRLLDLVVVKGRVDRDEHGNTLLEASGWHLRSRPKLRDGLRWPQ